MSRLAVQGRETDRPGQRDPGRVKGDLSPGQDIDAASWQVQGRHGRAGRGTGADERQTVPRRSKVGLDRGVGNRQVLAPAALWVQQGEPVAALLSVPTGDAPISNERIARVVELQGASANSAAIGSNDSTWPSRSRYRFHQPDRSETKCRLPSALHSGCTTDSWGPPTTCLAEPSRPSGPRSATHRSAPSQGMQGRSQVSQARRRPSGLGRGAA